MDKNFVFDESVIIITKTDPNNSSISLCIEYRSFPVKVIINPRLLKSPDLFVLYLGVFFNLFSAKPYERNSKSVISDK